MTNGSSAFGSAATLPLYLVASEIDWPFRFSIHGMTIGFLGDPSRPIVDAIGMPVSMCVAWMSPFDSESRIAAQLAPLMTVELMPYFLNSPFSCAITMGELSVSAMMPKRMSVTSGAVLVAPQLARARNRPMPPKSAAAPPMNFRRDGLVSPRNRLVFLSMAIVLAALPFPTFFADHRWS